MKTTLMITQKYLRSLLLMLMFSAISIPAIQAQNNDDEDPCTGVQHQLNMNLCAQKQYKEADAELNLVWKDIQPEGGFAKDAPIRKAQRLWIQFRDAHCDCEAGFFEGGSIQPMIYSTCMKELTEARTQQLKELFEEY